MGRSPTAPVRWFACPTGEYLAGMCMEATGSTARYGVALFDAQGRRSPRWSTDYRSDSPASFLLLSPDARRLVIDGIAELSLDFSGANFSYLSNALPPVFGRHAARSSGMAN